MARKRPTDLPFAILLLPFFRETRTLHSQAIKKKILPTGGGALDTALTYQPHRLSRNQGGPTSLKKCIKKNVLQRVPEFKTRRTQ